MLVNGTKTNGKIIKKVSGSSISLDLITSSAELSKVPLDKIEQEIKINGATVSGQIYSITGRVVKIRIYGDQEEQRKIA